MSYLNTLPHDVRRELLNYIEYNSIVVKVKGRIYHAIYHPYVRYPLTIIVDDGGRRLRVHLGVDSITFPVTESLCGDTLMVVVNKSIEFITNECVLMLTPNATRILQSKLARIRGHWWTSVVL